MEKLDIKDTQTLNIVDENIKQLKEIFPEVLREDKVDFDRLQELLGNYVNDSEENYNFTWHGKRRAARLAQTPSTGTLRPCKEESVDFDKTQNLFIEGDNLEVLKLLQKSYHRKVKMIYIDPPYNTGNEFVYEDDFKDGVKHYLAVTNQIDSEGKKLGTNSSSAGRYHTNWLNMMYPRLKLARNLLRDDGVIFISIDDNEQDNLKKICNEIFGEENYLQQIVWKRHAGGGNDAKHYAVDHEYILCFAKNKNFLSKLRMPLSEQDKAGYKEKDEHFDIFGPYKTKSFRRMRPDDPRPTLEYNIEAPDGEILRDTWKWEESKFLSAYKKNKVLIRKDRNQKWQVEYKIYLYDYDDSDDGDGQEEKTKVPRSLLLEVERNSEGKKQLRALLGEDNIFNNPKPIGLINYLASFGAPNEGDIILDFFAGSGTTANATMQTGKNRFIAIQLPEIVDEKSSAYKSGYKRISEIAIQRLFRAAKKIKEENPDYKGDLGFKVLKLDSSNIKTWEADFDSLEQDLMGAVDYIKQDRSKEDILYELLLKYGLDLTAPIETKNIAGKTVYSVGLGALIVCLESDISVDVVNGIVELKEQLKPEVTRVVFKDSGFTDDVVKTNALQILKRAGIEDVKSL